MLDLESSFWPEEPGKLPKTSCRFSALYVHAHERVYTEKQGPREHVPPKADVSPPF